jgi:DNA repair protein RadC
MESIKIVKIYQVRQTSAIYDAALSRPHDVINLVKKVFANLDREITVVVGLNTANHPNVINIVSTGTVDSAVIVPRDVFKPLILSNCRAFILLHNHPAGTLSPSECDKEITRKLIELGKMMQIELLDHLIIGCCNDFVSFRERNLI